MGPFGQARLRAVRDQSYYTVTRERLDNSTKTTTTSTPAGTPERIAVGYDYDAIVSVARTAPAKDLKKSHASVF